MDAKSSISVDLEERLARDWNMNLKPILILTEAPNRETLLQWQESILNTLHQNHAKFLSFNPWLPSMALQSSRRAWWTQTVTKPHAQHWDNFCQVSQTIGLKPEFCRSAFDSYVKVPTTLPATSSLALLGRMEKSFMADTQERSLGLILVNESWESLQNLRATLPPHSLLLSRSHLAEEMARGIKDEFLELSFLAALTILVCCAWAFKDFKKTLRAIFPVFAGLLGLLGGMGWLGFSADLMTVMMMVMILGAGVDYGIVLIHEASEKNGPQTAGMVVAICTSTTVLSLLSMSTSGHPVFLSIGWTGGLGILGVSLLSFIFCHRFKSSV